ncbi:hypothetical protein CL658_05095 [bacterium]|nr:hypothetical protein [bacterium]
MQEINLEAFSSEIADSYYYKKLQKELRDKKIKKQKQITNQTNSKSHITEKSPPKQSNKSLLDTPYFQDNVKLSNQELNTFINEENPDQKQESRIKELTETFKYNGHAIMRQLAHKINFFERKDEFIEMYKYNLQQSKSHNVFTSRFARFKVGIVGQILTTIGIPIETLKKLQRESMKELFEENHANMKENIYHAELNEILHGKSKKTKRKIQLFVSLQQHLMIQMNNLGRLGFWSKQKLYEEKITQCEKIKEEFISEKKHLEYVLYYLEQKKVS